MTTFSTYRCRRRGSLLPLSSLSIYCPWAPFYSSVRSVCTGPCIGCIALYFWTISRGSFLPECVFAVFIAATSPILVPAAVLWFMHTSELRGFHVKNNSSNVEQGWICFQAFAFALIGAMQLHLLAYRHGEKYVRIIKPYEAVISYKACLLQKC